jgi:hypothetical protein
MTKRTGKTAAKTASVGDRESKKKLEAHWCLCDAEKYLQWVEYELSRTERLLCGKENAWLKGARNRLAKARTKYDALLTLTPSDAARAQLSFLPCMASSQ